MYRIKYVHGKYIPQRKKYLMWWNITGIFPELYLSKLYCKELPTRIHAQMFISLYRDQVEIKPKYYEY